MCGGARLSPAAVGFAGAASAPPRLAGRGSVRLGARQVAGGLLTWQLLWEAQGQTG